MIIKYSHHAKYQIIERKIERVWVEETIKCPDYMFVNKNKYYVVKKLNGKTLKVVFAKKKYIKVIALFWL